MRIVDLSQDLFTGMPAFEDHPRYSMEVAVTHEQRRGLKDALTVSPVVHSIHLTEHTGTHVDAFNHFGIPFAGRSVDAMPLEMFYTDGICLDFTHKGLLETIEPEEIDRAARVAGVEIRPKSTVLLCTDHYRRHFGTEEWTKGPGITPDAARWLAGKGVYAFGVETRSPGILGKGNVEIHTISGERNFTHYENLVNLYQLLGVGVFQFIAFPLKIRGGTGSPVRAVAILED